MDAREFDSMTEFSRVKALAFDYYGTIADKQALAGVIDQHFLDIRRRRLRRQKIRTATCTT